MNADSTNLIQDSAESENIRPERDSGAPIRVLLADDHTILRAGLRMMLSVQPDIEIVGEASDGRQAIAEAQRLQPDVILMDITMPEVNGIEATRQVKKLLPETRVLVLTMHENEEYMAISSHALLPSNSATGIRHAASPDPSCSITFS